ncbi:hypothetical protein PY254_01300 [Rhodanobacter sp. AS-Z3]|uniref:hypothetical protein n=1 Tax=Rhodanobacter sp. AS-Z3 TaxID=3031330 RepID=UPI002478BE86|nr:hypothetical protein [Rhodanobacter sp. AS-Z3]WEN15344.1 hypothetical protein PY254_01300 [Rhodanobacter sp. AS-Z3]
MRRSGPVLRYASAAILLSLGGCATSRPQPPPPAIGDASWRMEVPPGTARYQLALGEVSSGATPFQRVSPVYPPAQLASCPPPAEISALLVVDVKGAVSDVRIADEAQADPARQGFISAVRAAALQWQFSPLQINHWAADADGNTHVVDSETRPFSLTYVFRFECHAGKSTVSAAAAKS